MKNALKTKVISWSSNYLYDGCNEFVPASGLDVERTGVRVDCARIAVAIATSIRELNKFVNIS